MTKVAIKNENITSFEEFIILWMFFQSWVLKNLLNPCWANVEVVARHSVMEVFSALSSSVTFAVENVLRLSMCL